MWLTMWLTNHNKLGIPLLLVISGTTCRVVTMVTIDNQNIFGTGWLLLAFLVVIDM